MNANAVKFLERKRVIQFFGICLVLAPFVNALLVIQMKMQAYKLTWAQVNILNTFKGGMLDNPALSLFSIIIGAVMLKGSTKAWKAALFLVGFHIAMQAVNYKIAAKDNVLFWPFLLVNISVFIFIADQLVWKIEIPQRNPQNPTPSLIQTEILPVVAPKVIHLKTYKKIYLKHDQPTPWAEIKNMNSQGFQAHGLSELPAEMISKLRSRSITLKVSPELTLRAQLKNYSGNVYSYEFFAVSENHVELINAWFKKIAV